MEDPAKQQIEASAVEAPQQRQAPEQQQGSALQHNRPSQQPQVDPLTDQQHAKTGTDRRDQDCLGRISTVNRPASLRSTTGPSNRKASRAPGVI